MYSVIENIYSLLVEISGESTGLFLMGAGGRIYKKEMENIYPKITKKINATSSPVSSILKQGLRKNIWKDKMQFLINRKLAMLWY